MGGGVKKTLYLRNNRWDLNQGLCSIVVRALTTWSQDTIMEGTTLSGLKDISYCQRQPNAPNFCCPCGGWLAGMCTRNMFSRFTYKQCEEASKATKNQLQMLLISDALMGSNVLACALGIHLVRTSATACPPGKVLPTDKVAKLLAHNIYSQPFLCFASEALSYPNSVCQHCHFLCNSLPTCKLLTFLDASVDGTN